MPEPAHDALDALRARLEETRLHAERLAAEAARARADHEGRQEPAGDASAVDLQAIAALLETLRDLVPPELQQQLAEVTRQVLLLLRALIDWWVDRLEEPGDGPGGRGGTGGARFPGAPPVQDIPVR